jgi:hypothetical protein
MAVFEDLQEDQTACRVQNLQPEIVDLCGAPHNLIYGETAVMWSRLRIPW